MYFFQVIKSVAYIFTENENVIFNNLISSYKEHSDYMQSPGTCTLLEYLFISL